MHVPSKLRARKFVAPPDFAAAGQVKFVDVMVRRAKDDSVGTEGRRAEYRPVAAELPLSFLGRGCVIGGAALERAVEVGREGRREFLRLCHTNSNP